ncbi:hypothetical protein BMMON2_20080 [Burkholderia mallei]
MELRDGPLRIEERGLQRDLVLQLVEIRARALAVARRDFVAAAIEAGGRAERNVEIERQFARRRAGIGRRADVIGGIEVVAELRAVG